ncbi:MAG: TonB family protein [Acidobacteriota bacterium]
MSTPERLPRAPAPPVGGDEVGPDAVRGPATPGTDGAPGPTPVEAGVGVEVSPREVEGSGEGPTGEAPPSSAQELLERLAQDAERDRKRLRRTVAVAVAFHLVLLVATFPDLSREPEYVAKPGRVFVMEQTRFKKPPAKPKAAPQQIPKKKAKRIPIPDPTPDEPEPIVIEDVAIPELEETTLDEVFFGIPEGDETGAGGSAAGDFDGVAEAGDGTSRPEKIYYPQPLYTEQARLKRIQGVAILLAIIDEQGNVRNLQVVKGLPLGLTESASETVKTWRFKPAVELATGKPIPVKMYLTINFGLQ